MARTQVSARTLSDIFERRLRALYPKIQVGTFEIEALGSGRWQPNLHRDPLPDPILADAFALVEEMQSQFDLMSRRAAGD